MSGALTTSSIIGGYVSLAGVVVSFLMKSDEDHTPGIKILMFQSFFPHNYIYRMAVVVEFKHFILSDDLIPSFQKMYNFSDSMYQILRDFDRKFPLLGQEQELEFNYTREADALAEKYPRSLPRGAEYTAEAESLKRRDYKHRLNTELRVIYDTIKTEVHMSYSIFRGFMMDYIASKRGDAYSKFLSAVSYGTRLLLEKMKDRTIDRAPPTYLVYATVNNVARIFVTVTPLPEGQEHIYIFRDPILDFLDEINDIPLIKGLAIPLHIYALHLFHGKHLYTTPLKIMTEMLGKLTFLHPIVCGDCPGKNDPDGVGNTNGWLVDYTKISTLEKVADDIIAINKKSVESVIFQLDH